MRWICLVFSICLLTSVSLSAEIRLDADEQTWLEAHQSLRIVSQSQYAPFEFRDTDGNQKGMSIDLIHWIATELGVQLQFVDTTFQEAQQLVLADEADILTSLFYSETRDLQFDFSEEIFEVPAHLFVPTARFDISQLEHLEGKRIAIQRGDYALEFLRKEGIEFTWITCQDFGESADKVVRGGADLMIGDWQITLYHLDQSKQSGLLKWAGDPVYVGSNRFALREGQMQLQSILNKGLQAARDVGILDKIQQRWLGKSDSSQNSQLNLRRMLWALGVLGLAAIAFLGWNLHLRKMVVLRTRELAESEAHYRGLFFNPSLPQLLLHSRDGEILEANQAAAHYLGLEDPGGHKISEFLTKEHQELIPAFHAETATRVETEIQDSRKQVRPTLINVVRIAPGLEGSCFIQLHDISGQKQAEQERQQMESRMLQAQKLEGLGVLTGGIAHDFNNLLVGILGNTDLLCEDQDIPKEMREPLLDIRVASRRAAELCRQMLAYAGKAELQRINFELTVMLLEMRQLLQVALSSGARLFLPTPGVPLAVFGDPVQLRQVLMNLILNASEALDEKGGEIHVRIGVGKLEREKLNCDFFQSQLKNAIWVEVEDNGSGIAAEHMERIFDPFFTTKFTGRGLGMSAVLGILREHEGGIEIVSVPGKGTKVRVLLPKAKRQDRQMERRRYPRLEELDKDMPGTVLIVDDETGILRVCERIMKKAGMQAQFAQGGEAALKLLEDPSFNPVLVLTDHRMPGMDGFILFEEIRKQWPDLPVALMSGDSEKDLNPMLVEFRAAGFIQKPFHYDSMVEGIRRIMGRDTQP